MNAKETLNEWLADGDLERVIAGLRVVNKKLQIKEIAQDIDFQSGRYRHLQNEFGKGLISHADYLIELAKIRQSLQTNIHYLLDDWIVEELEQVPPGTGHTSNGMIQPIWKRWGIILVVSAIFIGVAGYTLKVFFVRENGDSMQLTVYFQDAEGKPVPELQNTGHVKVVFGDDLRYPVIGENGRSNIGEIPAKFRGREIEIVLVADGWEPVSPGQKYKMGREPVVLTVRRDQSLGLLQGIVKDRSGETFLAGALILVDNDTTIFTDSLGRFRLQLPPAKQRDTYYLTIKKDGFKTKNEYFKPNTGPIEVRLDQ